MALTDAQLDAIKAAHARAMEETRMLGEHGMAAMDAVPKLLAEVDRLRAEAALTAARKDAARWLAEHADEATKGLRPEDVERFLKRERDDSEPGSEWWDAVNDVLDAFRLHLVTGTPLTSPRPTEGPEAPFVGAEPLTEAEELRAEVERLRGLVKDLANPDPCQYDHHGGCQAHGYLSLGPGERCPHAVAQELLAGEVASGE